jgi:hypothetical protein
MLKEAMFYVDDQAVHMLHTEETRELVLSHEILRINGLGWIALDRECFFAICGWCGPVRRQVQVLQSEAENKDLEICGL